MLSQSVVCMDMYCRSNMLYNFGTVCVCVCVCVCVQVKVYCHEGEGNEQLDSMDLHDVKSELEKDAEKAEVREGTFCVLDGSISHDTYTEIVGTKMTLCPREYEVIPRPDLT